MRIIRTDRCKRAPMRSMHAPRRLSYDGLNRLTDWNLSYTCLTGVCPSHPTVVNATNYQYDTTGNLQQVTLNGQVVEGNSYGGANGGSALGATRVEPHALTTHQTGSTSTAYHYDSHGRQDQQIGGRTAEPIRRWICPRP